MGFRSSRADGKFGRDLGIVKPSRCQSQNLLFTRRQRVIFIRDGPLSGTYKCLDGKVGKRRREVTTPGHDFTDATTQFAGRRIFERITYSATAERLLNRRFI